MFGLEMDYTVMLPRVLEALMGEHEGEIWLDLHTNAPLGNVDSYNEALSKVRDALPQEIRGKLRVVAGADDCHELKWLIGRCDFFIGSRMYSSIAVLSQGVPCVGIAYSRKFRGVFETVGMRDWVVDGREVGTEGGISRVVELCRRQDEVRGRLGLEAEKARQRLEEAFVYLFRRAASSRPF